MTPAQELNETINEPLKLSEKIFRDMIHSSPDAIFIYVDEKIIFINNTGIKLLRASKEEEIVGRSIWDFIPVERHKSFKTSTDYIISNKKSCVSTEDKLLTIDGEILDIEISSTYINFDNKKGIQAFIRDITKRKFDEETLAATREGYRLLAENTKEAIAVIQDELVCYVNPKLCKITGFSIKQIRNKKFHKLVHTDSKDIVNSEYHNTLNGTKTNSMHVIKIIDTKNNERWFQLNSILTIWKRRPAVLIFFNDITETKNAQDALMLSEEKYRLLAENAKDIIIVYEEDGSINYINNSGYEILGIKRDAEKTINVKELLPNGKYLKPCDLIKNKDKDFISYKNRTEVINFIGEIIKLETIASPVKLDNEKYGILVVGRDITEMNHLEREMILISERMRQQVSRDLHDDLNPHLIGIEALTQVLYMNLKKNQIAEADAAKKISALINKAITKTHRLARGLCPIDIESSGIQTPLMNLIKLVRSLYGVECKFTYDESIIIEDITLATNLYYIAQEAVINAARYSGGSLITIILKQINNTLILSIEDNGSGISKEKKPDGDKTSGMGLKIMKYRAEIIDGVFSIHKNKPSGTIISVMIPISILKSEGRISYDGRFTKTEQETANIYS